MQKNKFLLAAFSALLLVAPVFVSCNNDDTEDTSEIFDAGRNGALVVNQGNYGQEKASWGRFTYANGTSDYQLTLPGTLGNTPQNIARVGNYLYVGDKVKGYVGVYTLEGLKKIKEIPVRSPQGVTVAGNKVLAIGGDSIYAIDTQKNEAVGRVYSGPKATYSLAVANGYIYVGQSMDWSAGSDQKNHVLKISLQAFDKTTTDASDRKLIEVGLNPYDKITTDATGNVFLVCAGNFGYGTPAVGATVWKIDRKDVATKVADGNAIAVRNNRLFVADGSGTDYTFKVYDTETNALVNSDFLAKATTKPQNITFMGINPFSGWIYFGGTPNGYSENGAIYEYKADGTFVQEHETGNNPFSILFY